MCVCVHVRSSDIVTLSVKINHIPIEDSTDSVLFRFPGNRIRVPVLIRQLFIKTDWCQRSYLFYFSVSVE